MLSRATQNIPIQTPHCVCCGKRFSNRSDLLTNGVLIYQAVFWGFDCNISTVSACKVCFDEGKIFLTPATPNLLQVVDFEQLPITFTGSFQSPSPLLSDEAIQRETILQIQSVQSVLQKLVVEHARWKQAKKSLDIAKENTL